jgi:hypothetical protein
MKKGTENGTTWLIIDTTRLTNLVHEPAIATTGEHLELRGRATDLALGYARSCSGTGVLASGGLSSGFVGPRQ